MSVVRFAMGGMQIELVSRMFANGAEALAWAAQERGAWRQHRE